MLKEYLTKNKISMYALSKESGVPYSTLNDICNGKVTIENCKAGVVKRLSGVLHISMDEFYEICSMQEESIRIEEYNIDAKVFVKAKRFHSLFEYNGKPVDIDICKVNETNKEYVGEFAEWSVKEYFDKKFAEGDEA